MHGIYNDAENRAIARGNKSRGDRKKQRQVRCIYSIGIR